MSSAPAATPILTRRYAFGKRMAVENQINRNE